MHIYSIILYISYIEKLFQTINNALKEVLCLFFKKASFSHKISLLILETSLYVCHVTVRSAQWQHLFTINFLYLCDWACHVVTQKLPES